MISEIAAWLMTLFVVDPLQAQVREHLERANVSAQALQQSQQCISAQAPQLLKRAGEEPVWAVTTAAGVTLGWTSPAQLLNASDPNCAELSRILQTDEGAEAGS
jgi:hypothetical protein